MDIKSNIDSTYTDRRYRIGYPDTVIHGRGITKLVTAVCVCVNERKCSNEF